MVEIEDLTQEQRFLLIVVNKFGKEILKDNLYLQKVFFLITKLFPEEMEYFNTDYSAYNLGPYSTLVSETVERVKELGIIDRDTDDFSKEGLGLLRRVEVKEKENANELNEFLSEIEKIPKDELLYVIYTLYPEYAIKSKIKDNVHSALFESATIELEKLREGETVTFKTDKETYIKVIKKKGKIVIVD